MLVLRDTDGLGAPGPSANPAFVGQALADVAAVFPRVDRISDMYFDDANLWMTIVDPESPSRQRSIYWSEAGGLSVGEPEFMEADTTFPVSAVHVDAITALVSGLAERYPTLQVDTPRLSTGLSYELGLSWQMNLVDARGKLAVIFAELDGITWAGTVSPDGQLSVTIVYDFGDDQVRESDIWLPSGARFVHADGAPIATSSGRYGSVQSRNTLTVTYERVGAVTRYSDGVIVDFAGVDSFDGALVPCATCHLGIEGYGNTSITGALFADDLSDARIAISGVDQLRTGIDDGALRFVGAMLGTEAPAMIAWLPVAAAPAAPAPSSMAMGETVSQVWGATRAASDDRLAEATSGPPIGEIAAAMVLTAMWALLAMWILYRTAVVARVMSREGRKAPIDRDGAFSAPSDLEPALVGVIVGDTGPGERSAVAATLLILAYRGVIRIDGIDSERYTLTIPPGARGATTFEEAVLAELRPHGKVSATATLTGPPLWGDSRSSIERRLTGVALAEAKQARLVRVTLTAWVLIPASLAMGIVALIASVGSSWLAWAVTFVGPLLAVVATVLTGMNLTAKGRGERRRWLEYGDWLRTNTQLQTVGAPGVATLGEPLAYAAVLGAAPKAAGALGLR